ncbi:unnamed protein product [Prorocentrum cordatum]|uniref:Uncharacterized protein n=1 Tax=Prorocentrum cordatum TaxID=2364126 RepID=A0ABN9V583_9DINO|nr:unnamed protein product [Polarella glacialis]
MACVGEEPEAAGATTVSADSSQPTSAGEPAGGRGCLGQAHGRETAEEPSAPGVERLLGDREFGAPAREALRSEGASAVECRAVRKRPARQSARSESDSD